MMHLINDNLHIISDLCRRYNVRRLYAFGSVLTKRFNAESDVDILVDFNQNVDHNSYADNFIDFYHALKRLFGREVDLVDETAVKNPYFRAEFEETKHLIYG